MEQLEVEERRNKALESLFKGYMETPAGKKTLESSARRRKELGTNYKKRKPSMGKVIDRLPNIEFGKASNDDVVKDLKF